MSQTRRSGFTLMELLAVMLLIITVMAMGVPAMFAAERKSYVNQAMNDLIRAHQKCMKLQRELAARGESLIVEVNILNSTTTPIMEIKLTGTSSNYPTDTDRVRYLEQYLQLPFSGGSSYPQYSINSDEFIQQIDQSNMTTANRWQYEAVTGFIAPGSLSDPVMPITLTFRALKSGANWKMSRELHLYPQGYSEAP